MRGLYSAQSAVKFTTIVTMTNTSLSIQIKLLGGLAVSVDGQTRELPASRKCRGLLAWMLSNAGPHRRETLCELLWSDTDDPRAGLRWALTKLRPLLGDALVTDRHTVWVDRGALSVDLLQLEQGLSSAAGASPDDLQRWESRLREGYFPGLDCDGNPAFGQWLATERTRLQELHLNLLKRLRNTAEPDSAVALAYARRRVGVDPLDVEANLDLCACLLVQEGIASARKHLESARSHLRRAQLDDANLLAGWLRLSGEHALSYQRASASAQPTPSLPEPALPPKPSVAVLGFEDIGEPNVLSVGMTADLISRLSRLGGLFVIARASSTRFDPATSSFPEIGSRLGVRYLVHGAVQQHRQQIRLRVQLVEASQSRQIWSEVYDRSRDDLFLLQDELTGAIVSAIEPEIERAEYARANLKPPESLDAWENYHMALWHSFRFTAQDTERASVFLKRALEQDPGFSRAHAAMSLAHFSRAFLNASDDIDRDISRALAYAEQSVGLDVRDAMGHWSLGRAQFLLRQHDLALDSLDRALQVNPNYAQGHYARGFVGYHAGEDEQILRELDIAQRLSPFDPLMFAITSSRALTMSVHGDLEEAARWAVSATLQPNAHFHIFAVAAICLELAGQREQASQQLAKALQRHPGYSREVFFRSFPHKQEERRQVMDDALRRLGLP